MVSKMRSLLLKNLNPVSLLFSPNISGFIFVLLVRMPCTRALSSFSRPTSCSSYPECPPPGPLPLGAHVLTQKPDSGPSPPQNSPDITPPTALPSPTSPPWSLSHYVFTRNREFNDTTWCGFTLFLEAYFISRWEWFNCGPFPLLLHLPSCSRCSEYMINVQ